MASKVCPSCKIEKEPTEYGDRTRLVNGERVGFKAFACKACEYLRQRAYKEKNRERMAIRDAEYNAKNKDIQSAKRKIYAKNNRDKRNAYIREYKKERKQKDPSFRIYENCRKRIWKTLRKNKTNKTNELLGCSKMFYQMWLAYTFDTSLNWSNYGTAWDIDHVVPIDSFDIKNQQEVLKCFNWRNTRALDKTENGRKSNNIEQTYISLQEKDLKQFDRIIKFKDDLKWAIRIRAAFKNVEGSETRTSNLKVI
jgi:hypothetical protein